MDRRLQVRAGALVGCLLLLSVPACRVGYRPAPLGEEQVLHDLQAIRLEALHPNSAAAAVAGGWDLSDGLTADESVAVALYLNPELRSRRLERGIAEAERVAAGVLPNPELELSWAHIEGFTKSLSTSALGLGLSWAPPRPGERAAKVAVAAAHVAEVRQEIAGAEWRLGADVRKAHATISSVEEQMRLAEAAVRSQERVLAFVRAKRAGGEANRLDESLVDVEVGTALQRKEILSVERDRARLALNRLLGIPPAAVVPLQAPPGGLIYRPFVLDAARLEGLMLGHRPDLCQARQEYRRTEEELRLACIQSMPWLRFGPSYERDGSAGDGSVDKFGLGLGFEIPIANRNQGEIGRLHAKRAQLGDAFRAKVHVARSEVNEALGALRARERVIHLFEERIRPALDQGESLLQAGLDAREIDLLRALTAQEKAIESRSAHVDALREYWSAAFELELALGMRLDDVQAGKE